MLGDSDDKKTQKGIRTSGKTEEPRHVMLNDIIVRLHVMGRFHKAAENVLDRKIRVVKPAPGQ